MSAIVLPYFRANKNASFRDWKPAACLFLPQSVVRPTAVAKFPSKLETPVLSRHQKCIPRKSTELPVLHLSLPCPHLRIPLGSFLRSSSSLAPSRSRIYKREEVFSAQSQGRRGAAGLLPSHKNREGKGRASRGEGHSEGEESGLDDKGNDAPALSALCLSASLEGDSLLQS